jgi:hypothetical protein
MAARVAQEEQTEMKQGQLLSMSKNCHKQAEARRLPSANGNDMMDESLERNEVQMLRRGQLYATR